MNPKKEKSKIKKAIKEAKNFAAELNHFDNEENSTIQQIKENFKEKFKASLSEITNDPWVISEYIRELGLNELKNCKNKEDILSEVDSIFDSFAANMKTLNDKYRSINFQAANICEFVGNNWKDLNVEAIRIIIEGNKKTFPEHIELYTHLENLISDFDKWYTKLNAKPFSFNTILEFERKFKAKFDVIENSYKKVEKSIANIKEQEKIREQIKNTSINKIEAYIKKREKGYWGDLRGWGRGLFEGFSKTEKICAANRLLNALRNGGDLVLSDRDLEALNQGGLKEAVGDAMKCFKKS